MSSLARAKLPQLARQQIRQHHANQKADQRCDGQGRGTGVVELA
jgi:hypothetical protein